MIDRYAGMSKTEFATQFAQLLVAFHTPEINSGDKEIHDAVLIKTIALTTLAFAMPATKDGILNYTEAMEKLATALEVLEDI
jgi:hypothetical protein